MERPLFGDELRRLRRAADLSMKAFARLVHYDTSYVSKLENGIKPPTSEVAAACDAVLGTGEHLQELVAASRTTLHTNHRPPMTVTPGALYVFESLLDAFVQADALLGPEATIGGVREQLRILETLIPLAPDELRENLLRLGARYLEHAGWLAQDSGDLKSAARWSVKALDLAAELGDAHLISYIWMRRSNIATDAARPAESLNLARVALREDARLTPALKALGLRQLANAYAIDGNARGCARAIDDALMAIEVDEDIAAPNNNLAQYCTHAYLRSEGAACWMKLGDPQKAIALLHDTVDAWPLGQDRDRSLAMARLARAHLLAGHLEEACREGKRAILIRQSVASARAARELRKLWTQLQARSSHPEVSELLSMLRAAT
jgi:transcriptional regulator with XRE-family HTH domain